MPGYQENIRELKDIQEPLFIFKHLKSDLDILKSQINNLKSAQLSSKKCQINKGILPKTICHPVTATGSLSLQQKRINTGPSAIATAAPSLQTSPLSQRLATVLELPSNHQ